MSTYADSACDWLMVKRVAIVILDCLLFLWSLLYFVPSVRTEASQAWTWAGLDQHYKELWLFLWMINTLYLLVEVLHVFSDHPTIIGLFAIFDIFGVLMGFISACISPLLWVEQLLDIPVAALMVLCYFELKDTESEESLQRRFKRANRRQQSSTVETDCHGTMSCHRDGDCSSCPSNAYDKV